VGDPKEPLRGVLDEDEGFSGDEGAEVEPEEDEEFDDELLDDEDAEDEEG